MFRLERSTAGVPLKGGEPKTLQEMMCCSKLVPLRGENNSKPRPQNRIMVQYLYLLGFFFSKFPMSTPILFIWQSPQDTNQMIQPEISSFKFNEFQLRRSKKKFTYICQVALSNYHQVSLLCGHLSRCCFNIRVVLASATL